MKESVFTPEGVVGRWRRRSFGLQSANMDPRPAGHHVYDLHLWVHAGVEATPLPRVWEGKRQSQETNYQSTVHLETSPLKKSMCASCWWRFGQTPSFFFFPVFFLLDLIEVISDTERAIQLGENQILLPSWSHQVVCKSCSSNKCHLEYRKNELLRVCDQCALTLQQQKCKPACPSGLNNVLIKK